MYTLFAQYYGKFPYNEPPIEYTCEIDEENLSHKDLENYVYEYVLSLNKDIDAAGYRTTDREEFTYYFLDDYRCNLCTNFTKCTNLHNNIIKVAGPWFACEESLNHKCRICNQFQLSQTAYPYGMRTWTNVYDYIAKRSQQYKDYNRDISLTINGDKSIWYYVSYNDWFNNDIIELKDGKKYLKAKSCSYYKKSKTSPYGYILHNHEELKEYPEIKEEISNVE